MFNEPSLLLVGLEGSSFPKNGLLSRALSDVLFDDLTLWFVLAPKAVCCIIHSLGNRFSYVGILEGSQTVHFLRKRPILFQQGFYLGIKDCQSCLVFLLGLSVSSSSSTTVCGNFGEGPFQSGTTQVRDL